MSDWFIDMLVDHVESLPEIQRLDEYMHFHDQLVRMRRDTGDEYRDEVYAMQLGVLIRLWEYDQKIGMPELEMPGTE